MATAASENATKRRRAAPGKYLGRAELASNGQISLRRSKAANPAGVVMRPAAAVVHARRLREEKHPAKILYILNQYCYMSSLT